MWIEFGDCFSRVEDVTRVSLDRKLFCVTVSFKGQGWLTKEFKDLESATVYYDDLKQRLLG